MLEISCVNLPLTSLKSHVDRHVTLRNSVHGTTDERGLELDLLGEVRCQVNLVNGEGNVTRH